MIRGWKLTAGALVLLAAAGLTLDAGLDAVPGILGVPALLFPDEGRERVAGAERAATAERRLEAFLAGRSGADSIALSEGEVGGILRRRLRGRLPPGISDVRVRLRGPTAAVSARVRFDSLELAGAVADRLNRLLGDSTRVEVELEPSVSGRGSGRVALTGLRAGGFSLPSGLAPMVLSRLGLETGGGDGTTVRVPVPPRLTSITVERDRLVLARSDAR